MKTYTLTRTGNRPLQFEGELIAEKSTEITHEKEHNRWHDLALYRTGSGQFLISVVYDSRWIGEDTVYTVEEVGNIESVSDFLQHEYDPLQFAGIEKGRHRTENDEIAENNLVRRYNLAVSKILSDFPELID